jgi:hypothetical protein
MFIRDVGLTVKNLPFIINSIKASKVTDQSFRAEYSELERIAKTNKLLFSQIAKMIFGEKNERQQLTVKPCKNKDHWFYINGIMTTKEISTVNQLALNKIFDVDVSLLYNPTHGFFSDLWECVRERTFNEYADITKQLYQSIEDSIKQGNKIKLIGHSQGGVIISNILKMLKESGKKYPNIEIYTFASAADEDIEVPGVYQEHFVNENDFVSRVGMLHFNHSSNMYVVKNGNGHLLNRDYLEHFKSGKFCGRKSRLFKYVKE